jgi:hypothetical protein
MIQETVIVDNKPLTAFRAETSKNTFKPMLLGEVKLEAKPAKVKKARTGTKLEMVVALLKAIEPIETRARKVEVLGEIAEMLQISKNNASVYFAKANKILDSEKAV